MLTASCLEISVEGITASNAELKSMNNEQSEVGVGTDQVGQSRVESRGEDVLC